MRALDIGNPDPSLGQAHKCGRVKLINGIPTLSPLDNWVFNGNK
jgi:hypothetical protein